jgi:predicted PurR-regulated permease PerM
MDQQNQNPYSPIQNNTAFTTPNQNPTSPTNNFSAPKPRKFGPVIAISIIILVIIVIAIYLFASQINVNSPTQDNINTGANTISSMNDQNNTTINTTPETIAPISNNADDINSLQKDLDSSIQGIDTQNI